MSKSAKTEKSADPAIDDAQTEETAPPNKEKGEGPGPSAGGSVDLDSIASYLSAEMPEVQQHAIEQEKATENEKLARYVHLKDRDGNGFDPSLHKTKKDGEPTLSPKGVLIKKPGRKPGRKPGQKVGGASNSVIGGQKAKQQARASGTFAANLLLQLGIVIGGQEWQPRRDEESGMCEKTMLEGAFADYFEATGKTDIPPGIALTVAIGGYALPRLTMPHTQKRVSGLKQRIKQWWVNRKMKKYGMKAEPIEKEKDKQEPTKTEG